MANVKQLFFVFPFISSFAFTCFSQLLLSQYFIFNSLFPFGLFGFLLSFSFSLLCVSSQHLSYFLLSFLIFSFHFPFSSFSFRSYLFIHIAYFLLYFFPFSFFLFSLFVYFSRLFIYFPFRSAFLFLSVFFIIHFLFYNFWFCLPLSFLSLPHLYFSLPLSLSLSLISRWLQPCQQIRLIPVGYCGLYSVKVPRFLHRLKELTCISTVVVNLLETKQKLMHWSLKLLQSTMIDVISVLIWKICI